LIAPDGRVAAQSRDRHGGPPYFWLAEVASPAAGTWRATLAVDRAPAACSTITREIAVRATQPPRPSATSGSVWPLRNTWNRATENLFSAWIEKLFDDPLDALPRVVEYREGGTSASPAGTISRARPRAGGVSPARISSTERTRDEAAGTCAEAAGARSIIRRLYADRCRRRPFRIRANGGER